MAVAALAHLLEKSKAQLAICAALAGFSGVIEVRGVGLMIGSELDRACGSLVGQARDQGLLINVTSERVVRLLPPLIFSEDEARQTVEILVPLIKKLLDQ